MKSLVLATATCLLLVSANLASPQSGRTGWDGTWVGGWDRNPGVQIIFAGETLIGFYFRNDYKDITRSNASPDGGRAFAWDKGEATLTRSPGGGAVLVVRERGKPDVSIPLKREGG
jgi:hypothetical protein